MALVDSFGRRINYLRLSVTDRCNFRCRYCMPEKRTPEREPRGILGYEDLFRVARAAVSLGVEKIRVTGGEPLHRDGIVRFLEELAVIPGLKRLVVTTNGVLLGGMANALRAAGVDSLNISLDSLRPEVFSRITRGGDLRSVLRGIAAAGDAGFPSVKINVVVMRGVNDAEIFDFARLSIEMPYKVRFIEYMPTVPEPGWRSLVVPGEEIKDRLSDRYAILPVAREDLMGPAREFKIGGAAGTIGIIAPISCGFCEDCNRIRVTAMGIAKGCLFESSGLDLTPFLGERYAPAALMSALRGVVYRKPEKHGLSDRNTEPTPFLMSQVGG
jgi:cyclic pyranopterin phosphate synthase